MRELAEPASESCSDLLAPLGLAKLGAISALSSHIGDSRISTAASGRDNSIQVHQAARLALSLAPLGKPLLGRRRRLLAGGRRRQQICLIRPPMAESLGRLLRDWKPRKQAQPIGLQPRAHACLPRSQLAPNLL